MVHNGLTLVSLGYHQLDSIFVGPKRENSKKPSDRASTDLDSHPGDASNHSCETFGSQGVFQSLEGVGGWGFFFL